jgi:hypothetical protein
MSKVHFFDKRVFGNFLKIISVISAVFSLVLIFIEIPTACKTASGLLFILMLILIYIANWIWSNKLNKIEMTIDGSKVIIKVGDIFLEPGLKVIAFNEYFDTIVDNVIISEKSLHGLYIQKHLRGKISDLDQHIDRYSFAENEIIGKNEGRKYGKKIQYQLGTICVYDEYLLTAFSKFDMENKAILTMPEYLEFFVNFWDRINKVYALQCVTVPVIGSGITRIKEHKNISDEDLLKIMLWTFRISEMRFKYPAKLTIVIHKDKIAQINLLDIQNAKYGL